jgi:hypothetical protein
MLPKAYNGARVISTLAPKAVYDTFKHIHHVGWGHLPPEIHVTYIINKNKQITLNRCQRSHFDFSL